MWGCWCGPVFATLPRPGFGLHRSHQLQILSDAIVAPAVWSVSCPPSDLRPPTTLLALCSTYSGTNILAKKSMLMSSGCLQCLWPYFYQTCRIRAAKPMRFEIAHLNHCIKYHRIFSVSIFSFSFLMQTAYKDSYTADVGLRHHPVFPQIYLRELIYRLRKDGQLNRLLVCGSNDRIRTHASKPHKIRNTAPQPLSHITTTILIIVTDR